MTRLARALAAIADTILDEASPPVRLRQALDDYAQLCSDISGILPNPSFDGWAADALLDSGVAINPQAAAYCVKDYQRSVVFMRALYAAMQTARTRFTREPTRILYAGCGPFATLLLPLLGKFNATELDIQLLDIHQQSLDSVRQLLACFGFSKHRIKTLQADACSYQHPCTLHIIIAETMQKALEQEPQFAVSANLAPQLCPQGIFIPEKIEVALCLAHLAREEAMFARSKRIDHQALVKAGERHPLASVFTLLPMQAAAQRRAACYNKTTRKLELNAGEIAIPAVANLADFDPLLLTRIQVFARYQLRDYEAAITLPLRCHELLPLRAGATYRTCYQLGNYPKIDLTEKSIGPGEKRHHPAPSGQRR